MYNRTHEPNRHQTQGGLRGLHQSQFPQGHHYSFIHFEYYNRYRLSVANGDLDLR